MVSPPENKRKRSSLDSTSGTSNDNQDNESSVKSRKTSTSSKKSIAKDMDGAAPNVKGKPTSPLLRRRTMPRTTTSPSSSSHQQNRVDSVDIVSASSNIDMGNDSTHGRGISDGQVILTSAHKQLLQQQWVIEANSHRQSLPAEEHKAETKEQMENNKGRESSTDKWCLVDADFQFKDIYADNQEEGKDQESSENEFSREKPPGVKKITSPAKSLNTNFKDVVRISKNTIIAAPRPRVVSVPPKPRGEMPFGSEEESGDDYNSNVRIIKSRQNGSKNHNNSSTSSSSETSLSTASIKLEKQIPPEESASCGLPMETTDLAVRNKNIVLVRIVTFCLICISISVAFLLVRQSSNKSTISTDQLNLTNGNKQIPFDKTNDSKSKIPDDLNFNIETYTISEAVKSLESKPKISGFTDLSGFTDFKMDTDLMDLSESMLRQLNELEGEALQLRTEVRYDK